MRELTKDRLTSKVKSRFWNLPKKLSFKYGRKYGVNSNTLLSIFAIETFYRPFYFRIVEYCAVIIGCFQCLLLKKPMKNYTIGKCQLGIATILNFYGGSYYQHSQRILIHSAKEAWQILCAISTDRCIEILAYRLQPIADRAKKIYPDKYKSYLRYIGEQFNGRYSYGMLLTEVCHHLENIP